ncbi:MAG: hypothetical protein HC908_00355 [Calothrix sp. SM1_7_51]|nr:hypothetical protein [Calothrix sp. SM1_7_51]
MLRSNLMSGDIFLEASDEKTPPDRLDGIYQQNRNRGYRQRLISAIAANPNSSLELLKQLFINEPGMANIIIDNPVASLLLLENFNLFKEWVIEGQNRIFLYQQISPELQKIALSTENQGVWWELVKLKTTQTEVIDSIANSLSWSAKKPPNNIETLIKQEIAKNPNTSIQTLIKILKKQR